MHKFDLTTVEGNEAYLNDGDDRRVRRKEEGEIMTKPNLVVEALNYIRKNTCEADILDQAEEALPLAKEQAEKLEHYDELVEALKGTLYLFEARAVSITDFEQIVFAKAIIKQYLEEEK